MTERQTRLAYGRDNANGRGGKSFLERKSIKIAQKQEKMKNNVHMLVYMDLFYYLCSEIAIQ